MVRAPSTTRSASSRADSALEERRTGAPFSPERPGTSGGSHRAKARDPRGEPSWLTALTGRPTSRPADTSGEDTVAEASTNAGDPPYLAHTRRSRRTTWATCEPKIPR